MKRFLLSGTLLCCAVIANAADGEIQFETITPKTDGYVTRGGELTSNWFVTVQSGGNMFLGSPKGCGDMFDRLTTSLDGNIGKWFTGAWGVRFVWQGLNYKNCEFDKNRFHNLHMDLMYNLTNWLSLDENGMSKVDVAPYFGLGTMLGGENYIRPLSLSYGLFTRYHIGGPLHVVAEIGCTTTGEDFDGFGEAKHLGDRMFSATAGFSYTIGKRGWKTAVGAEPFIDQNRAMRDYINELTDSRKKDQRTIEELKKILEIEGLLERYQDSLEGASEQASSRNNYSGLNSLMSRLAGKSTVGKNTVEIDARKDAGSGLAASEQSDDSAPVIIRQEEIIGVPIFFFFKIGTNTLTDQSQLINLDEIVRIANKYNLSINVSGAADSATGSVETNRLLSQARTDVITAHLTARGIPSERIIKCAEGGISRYDQNEANRNSIVSLIKK